MKWSSLWILLLMSTPALAQETGRLYGTVHDSETSQPVAKAAVRIMALDSHREFTTTADERGRFSYLGLEDGTYIVTITKDGYAAIDIFDLSILRGESTRLRLTMIPAAQTTLKRQLIRYRRPLINTEDASIKTVFRNGVYR